MASKKQTYLHNFFGGAPTEKRKPVKMIQPIKKRARVMPVDLDLVVERLIAHLRDLSWRGVLANKFKEGYFVELAKFLEQERKESLIFPLPKHVFGQLELCPFDDIKVAHGLSFSVPLGVAVPPSLENIFKELTDDPDVDFNRPDHGNLEKWARQGVLLLNSVLMVEARQPGSHADRGWERFTDAIIKAIIDEHEGVVFMLWGRYAQNKGDIIDDRKHHVLTSAHLSLYSTHGFFGKRHFSNANQLLGSRRIDWKLDPKDVERENQRKWRIVVSSSNTYMDGLPDELLLMIFRAMRMDCVDAQRLKRVCTRWRSVMNELESATCPTADAAIEHNHPDCMMRTRSQERNGLRLCSYVAIRVGAMACLERLRKAGFKFDQGSCALAARCGSLRVLAWLRDNDCPWDSSTCTGAIDAGRLDIYDWARARKCAVTLNCSMLANALREDQ